MKVRCFRKKLLHISFNFFSSLVSITNLNVLCLDGSLMYERVLSRAEIEARRAEAAPAQPLKRRAYDDINGLDSQYR